jgi:cysteine-rich repeat protein
MSASRSPHARARHPRRSHGGRLSCLLALALTGCADVLGLAPLAAGGAGQGGAGDAGQGGSGGDGGGALPGVCGNGVVEAGEACDDQNELSGDGCRACRRVVALSSGDVHACALVDDGSVRCWGRNDQGQLGQGDTMARGTSPEHMGAGLPPIELGTDEAGAPLRAVSLCSGSEHSCVAFEDGRVKCWGGTYSGQLGLGEPYPRGDEPGEMGDLLPFVELGTDGAGNLLRAVEVVCGFEHSCARFDDGRVKCWGLNTSGELGLGQAFALVGDQLGDMGDNLPFVDVCGACSVDALRAGPLGTCALASGQPYCWGSNYYGQLARGDTEHGYVPEPFDGLAVSPVLDVRLGYGAICLLGDAPRRVVCAGWSGVGELGYTIGSADCAADPAACVGDAPGEAADAPQALLLAEPEALFASPGRLCARLVTGVTQCWGLNVYGSLGVGSDQYQLAPTPLALSSPLAALASGDDHACGLLEDARVVCWGHNAFGQLGNGLTLDASCEAPDCVGDDAQDAGDEAPPTLVP